MRKTILILAFLLQTVFYFGQSTVIKPENQSIISLIANKEKFFNKKLILKGFLTLEKHDVAIYLSKDDYLNFNTQNAIYLILSIDDMNRLDIGKMSRKYVSIIGTFYLSPNKNMQMGDNYIGALKDIEYVEIIEQRK